eukprot:6869317-Lingulodinium_polyedra.AAC.1
MARRQASKCDCGMSCVFTEQRHWARINGEFSAHPGPSTPLPTASMTRGGSPATMIPCPARAKAAGKRLS